MKTLQKYKNEQMKNPEFAKAYEEIQPEMNVIRAIADARALRNMTQKELSEKTGIAQTEINKIPRTLRSVLGIFVNQGSTLYSVLKGA